METDFFFRKNETGASYRVFAELITKTTQKGPHQKSRLQVTKMFETQAQRYAIIFFQKYLSKCPVGMEKSEPFYLQPVVNPLTNIWYKKALWESTILIL